MYVYTYVLVIYGGNINEILMQCNVCMYVYTYVMVIYGVILMK